MIALVVFTDGRWDVLERTLASAEENLLGPITRRVLVVDGTDRDQATRRVAGTDSRWESVYWGERRGFGGTIAAAWEKLSGGFDEQFVFHLEDDFTFNRPVDLPAIAGVLAARPELAQLVLRRQAWNDQEQAAGGIVECWPDEYVERRLGSSAWLEHRLFFSTNPCLYRRSLCATGWPTGERSEVAFTRRCLDAGLRFGFWGARDSGEAVHHIGEQRVGEGY